MKTPQATGNLLKAAALHLSVACGCLDAMKQTEEPKSARWNAVNNLEEKMWKALDLYRLSAFEKQDQDNAAAIIDLVNEKILEFYP